MTGDNSAVEPVETPPVEPVESPAVEPVESPAVEPVESPAVEPVESSVVEPVESSVVEPVETPLVEPVEPPLVEFPPLVELVETKALIEPAGTHARWLEAEGDRLLLFGAASRHPDGGFAWLDAAGRPELDRPVELWITCRMTHVFSLAQMMGRPGAGPLADHGVAALRGRFRDAANGGWYAFVGPDGPTVRSKTAYPHAFVVLAAASAACAGRPGAAALLDEALDVLLGHFWDDEHGMVVEEFDEAFAVVDPYRGVNANMHTVEALLSAADATGDAGLRDRAMRIVTRVVRDLAPAHEWRIPEHFDASWTPLPDYNVDSPAHPFRPYGATIGHWLEWARLSLHLRASLGSSAPAWLLDNAVALFDASVREGWTGPTPLEHHSAVERRRVVEPHPSVEPVATSSSVEPSPSVEPDPAVEPYPSVEPVETTDPRRSSATGRSSLSRPPHPVVEPVETPGFVYTVDWSGNPVVRERMHWVPAEATATAAALYAATGDASYADWYQTWWDHLAAAFIDYELGSWHHELDPTNHPSSTVWSGKPDVYHAFQATLIPRLPLSPTLATALRDGHLP